MANEVKIIDAAGKALGRVASLAAFTLRGKNKATYISHKDPGMEVVIENASKIKITGNKLLQKEYIRFSGYPGGQKRTLGKDMTPEKMLMLAIKGMLPRNNWKPQLLKRLTIKS